jgi:hypothetical protein
MIDFNVLMQPTNPAARTSPVAHRCAAAIAGKALALGLGIVMIGALSCGAPTAPAGGFL